MRTDAAGEEYSAYEVLDAEELAEYLTANNIDWRPR